MGKQDSSMASIFGDLGPLTGPAQAGDVALSDGRLVRVIPVDSLDPDPEQVRALGSLEDLQAGEAEGDLLATQSLARIRALADSIREIGLLVPLGVEETQQEGRYTVVHGHRRLLALQLGGARDAPCIVRTILPNSVRIRVQLAENLQREDLGEGEVYDAMAAYKKALATERSVPMDHVTWGEVENDFGVSKSNRQRIARLHRLGGEAYQLAKRARLSEYVLRPLLRHLQLVETQQAQELDEQAQLRIIGALLTEEAPSPTLVSALLKQELGLSDAEKIPSGRSLAGLKIERTWTGWARRVARLKEQWMEADELTDGDRSAIVQTATDLRVSLEEMLKEVTPPHG